jgi:hypothetical protein
VFSAGIVMLAVLAAALLVAFGGVTDRLIPLFAIGALLAFTLSQAGMVVHWRRTGGDHARRSLAINAAGAVATGVTLVVVAVSKLAEGAWIVLLVLPLVVLLFAGIRRHTRKLEASIATQEPIELPALQPPVVVVLAGAWTRVTQHALRFALRLSDDLHVVQIETDHAGPAELEKAFERVIARPARRARIAQPELVVLRSQFRQYYKPFIDFIHELERTHRERDIAVVVPELVTHHWYESLFHDNRAEVLRMLLAAQCSNRVVVITTPFHVHD